jgi:ribosomal protein S18 acetylase RimI-like enzyme
MQPAPSLRIRSYKPNDYLAIKRNLLVAGMFDEPWDSPSNYDSLVAEHPYNVLVAETDGQLVGSLLIDRYGAECAFIYRLVVDDGHRRSGVASHLLEEAHRVLREDGVLVVALLADARNTALINYYAKKGYTRLPHDYAPMWKRL